jgi:microcystin degradation protein MlrC
VRVAIASVMQETNTFVPFSTDLETFGTYYLRRGAELIHGFGSARVEVPGFLSGLRASQVQPIPILAAYASSGGPVIRKAFETIMDEIVERLRAAAPLDGVLLALHGAMVIEDEPDAEAEIVERVRAAIPAGTPVGASLDLHGHITPRMLQPDVFYIGYREFPHIDMFETGERVARLMLDRLAGRCRPVMALAKRPMIVSPVNARTTEGPLAAIVAAGRRMEAAGRIMHASVFPVQPWLDVPDLGFAALVCADGDRAAATAAAEELAEMAWQARHSFEPNLTPIPEAIRIGLSEAGTTVVGDPGDAPSSGSAADNPSVLRALLAAGADRAGRLTYLTLCDPEAATAAARAGVGRAVELRVGHKLSARDGQPLAVTGTVRALTDGVFTMHDGGAQGTVASLGLTAVVAIGDIRLAIRSIPGFEWDTGIYTSVGLDPRRAALVWVKSPSHFRVSYESIADRIVIADTPGPSCANIRAVPYTKLRRPIWPIDEL